VPSSPASLLHQQRRIRTRESVQAWSALVIPRALMRADLLHQRVADPDWRDTKRGGREAQDVSRTCRFFPHLLDFASELDCKGAGQSPAQPPSSLLWSLLRCVGYPNLPSCGGPPVALSPMGDWTSVRRRFCNQPGAWQRRYLSHCGHRGTPTRSSKQRQVGPWGGGDLTVQSRHVYPGFLTPIAMLA